jgi:hypothetical protein
MGASNQPVERARGTVSIGVEVGDRAADWQRSTYCAKLNVPHGYAPRVNIGDWT